MEQEKQRSQNLEGYLRNHLSYKTTMKEDSFENMIEVNMFYSRTQISWFVFPKLKI